MGGLRPDSVPAKVKVAVQFLIEQKNDLKAAAEHAGISLYELRRSLSRPASRRYALEMRQVALEAFCLGSPAALTRVRDTSENGIAVVNAIKAGEQLRVGAIEAETSAQRRAPGLQIVIVGPGGEKQIAHEPPPPMIDVPAAEVMPVPSEE
jgi:hypothetical protein